MKLFKYFYLIITLLLYSQAIFSQWQGAGTAQDPFRIYTVTDLENITNHQYDSDYTQAMSSPLTPLISYTGVHFKLMNDIEEPLTKRLCFNFAGHLHGKGHSVTLNLNNELDPDSILNSTFIAELFGSVDSLTFVGNSPVFYSLFNRIHPTGKISYIICNLDITPFAIIPNTKVAFIFCGENNGLIEYCVNNSNLSNNHNISQVSLFVFSWNNFGTIDNCINNGNISIHNVTDLLVSAIFAVDGGGNITNCINNGDFTISGVPAQSYISCFSYHDNNISHCINTGNINVKSGGGGTGTGTGANIMGIFSVSNGIVSNCLNTGNLTGNEIAGGIVGEIGNGIIENCLNAGYIDGDNYVGGIVGSFSQYGNYFTIKNNLDLSKTAKYALIGDDLTLYLTYPQYYQDVIIENNFYDKQMVTIPATPNGDITGKAEGKLTTEITGFALQSILGDGWSYAEGRYPIPLGLENHPAALLAATPIYLHATDTENYNSVDSVSQNFIIGLENNVEWQSAYNMVFLYEENGILQHIGYETLTGNLDNYSKNIQLNIRSIPSSITSTTFDEITIYPNPVKDILLIDNRQFTINNVEICDIAGKTLSTHSTNTINVSNLPMGVYLLKIYTHKGVKVEKIVKN